MKEQRNEVVFINYQEAQTLVDRIAERTEIFNRTMQENEKEAMAQLLSDVGVKVSDLIDVNYLADNYAINAEIVGPDDVDSYDRSTLEDALFTWKDDETEETHYVLSW